MKFCPKCGTQLVDEAKFCPKCGAPQPGMEPKEEPKVEETPKVEEKPVEEVKPAPAPEKTLSPRERYNNYLKNDECFRDAAKVIKAVSLISLINLLFIIPWLCSLLIPVGMFTGVNVSTQGMDYFNVLGASFPYEFSALSVRQFVQYADIGHNALTPGESLQTNPSAIIMLIFRIIYVPLLVLLALLGKTKSYILKVYEGPDGRANLLKTARKTNAIFGPFAALFTFSPALGTYLSCIDLKYDYSDGKPYIFGEVDGILPGFIACIVITVIFAVIILVSQLVIAGVLYNKKLKKYEAK